MRFLLSILLSCLLSLNLFLFADNAIAYDAASASQAGSKAADLDGLSKLGYYRREFKDENLNFRIAVLRFQSHNNLVADGIAGKKFRASLTEKLQRKEKLSYNDYVKQPAAEGLWITINKSKRILTVYQNKTAIKKYPVALGRTDFVTPKGKFAIKSKVMNPEWSGGGYAKPEPGGAKTNPLGQRWLGLNIGKNNKYGIHGNNNPYSIGQYVSRGCIRMLNSDVDELFKYVVKGTPVWIGSDKQLREWGVYQNSFTR